jgi:hypothetical protein
MKKIAILLALSFIAFSCDDDDETTPVADVSVNFNFSHTWEGNAIENSDFDQIQYTNENGEQLSISKLDYLISDITFTNTTTGAVFAAEDYNFISVRNSTNMNFTPNVTLPPGTYSVSFTFGFDDEDNQDGIYQDLNSIGWNVPMMLGGGYHYMRLEGKFIDNTSAEVGYQYHTIRAADITVTPMILTDTSFEVDLGDIQVVEGVDVTVEMDVAEWFKDPNTWDLNVLHSMLMPNYNAQIMMSQNGESVFSLGAVSIP